MDYIAGIDGGGTKTVLELRTMDNEVIRRRIYGAFNINSIGEKAFCKLMESIISDMTGTGSCKGICIGAAGYSNPLVERIIRETAEKAGITGRIKLVGDHETALYGAFGDADGIILIAGTGSICYGKSESGRLVRCGGWGHLIDDGGSAYAISRDALSAIVRAGDGREVETLLTGMIFQRLKINSSEELVPLLYGNMNKESIAALCPIVVEAAISGDETAISLIDKNINELIDMVRAVMNRLELKKTRICLLGGVLISSDYIRQRTARLLTMELSGLKITEPASDAASGATQIIIRGIK